jgi:hypothetical protein
LPSNPETGQLFDHTNYGKKMWNGTSWIEGDYTGKYDTLFLFKANGITPAHLNLDTLNCRHISTSTNKLVAILSNGKDIDNAIEELST